VLLLLAFYWEVNKVDWFDGATGGTPQMNFPIRIWSKAYAPTPDTENYSIQIDKSVWEKAMREEGSRRKFLRIEHPLGLEDWIAPIGHPVTVSVPHDEEANEDCLYDVFLPLWMIDAAQLGGEGEQSTLEILDEECFPEATRIVFRVVDSAIYNADVKDELEKALSSIGVIRKHSTLQIPVEALGGYKVEVFVSETEPANVVLCDGDEVRVEFEEPVDQIEVPRPPTPIPELPALLPTTMMLPETLVAPQQGFQAFAGQGRLLGGSNATIPEWRRGLPPPREPRRS
jgi:hypothetical protein